VPAAFCHLRPAGPGRPPEKIMPARVVAPIRSITHSRAPIEYGNRVRPWRGHIIDIQHASLGGHGRAARRGPHSAGRKIRPPHRHDNQHHQHHGHQQQQQRRRQLDDHGRPAINRGALMHLINLLASLIRARSPAMRSVGGGQRACQTAPLPGRKLACASEPRGPPLRPGRRLFARQNLIRASQGDGGGLLQRHRHAHRRPPLRQPPANIKPCGPPRRAFRWPSGAPDKCDSVIRASTRIARRPRCKARLTRARPARSAQREHPADRMGVECRRPPASAGPAPKSAPLTFGTVCTVWIVDNGRQSYLAHQIDNNRLSVRVALSHVHALWRRRPGGVPPRARPPDCWPWAAAASRRRRRPFAEIVALFPPACDLGPSRFRAAEIVPIWLLSALVFVRVFQ
jgi:hypothetical protein